MSFYREAVTILEVLGAIILICSKPGTALADAYATVRCC